ncbi:MAG: hypothetical protein CMJ58_00330 [Planctomycetaceae bacterium]|nr:hypothetical protein [Planctomycetaceae bacterium]
MSEILATQTLLSQAQGGSNEAREELFRRYQQRVLAAVRMRLGQRLRRKIESWDIVQEAMADAFQRIDAFEFRTEGAFLKLVNQIVENRIRDAAGHWGAQRRCLDRETPLDADGSRGNAPINWVAETDAPTPSKIAALNEDLSQLEQAMDQLGEGSEEQRDLLIAVKLEGRTYRELATELGISEDAVRMRVNRAMDSLTAIFRRLPDASH